MSAKVAERLAEVHDRLAQCAARAGREPQDVRLIAVSKTFPAPPILEAVQAGQRVFGENRVQEAAEKIPAVNHASHETLEWHGVGQLQRNKARPAVELFDVIHGLDRAPLADALERAASDTERRPRVLVQVDLDGEPQKGGAAPDAVPALIDHLRGCPSLALAGLMAIPRAGTDPEQVRPSFARLRELLERLRAAHPDLPGFRELSMGMTADFEVAVEEGATWVRVGTAIFGRRTG